MIGFHRAPVSCPKTSISGYGAIADESVPSANCRPFQQLVLRIIRPDIRISPTRIPNKFKKNSSELAAEVRGPRPAAEHVEPRCRGAKPLRAPPPAGVRTPKKHGLASDPAASSSSTLRRRIRPLASPNSLLEMPAEIGPHYPRANPLATADKPVRIILTGADFSPETPFRR